MEFFLKRVSICGVHDSSLLEYNYITHILILASIILQTQLPIHQYQMSHHIQTLIYTQKKKKKLKIQRQQKQKWRSVNVKRVETKLKKEIDESLWFFFFLPVERLHGFNDVDEVGIALDVFLYLVL